VLPFLPFTFLVERWSESRLPWQGCRATRYRPGVEIHGLWNPPPRWCYSTQYYPFLIRTSFYGSAGDVPTELRGDRIQLVERVSPRPTSLSLIGMLPSGRAELAGVSRCAHGPRRKGRQHAPEACSLPVVPLGAFRIPTIRHVSKGIPLHEGP